MHSSPKDVFRCGLNLKRRQTWANCCSRVNLFQVKNVVIDDGLPANVEDTAGYSVFLDPDNAARAK